MSLRNILIIVVVLLLLVGGWFSSQNGGEPVEVARVTRGDIRSVVEDRGKTRLPRTWNITMPFAGRVQSLAAFPEQTEVKEQQLLTQIVPADLQLRLDSATAMKQRIEASIVENNNVSVELVSKQQSEEMVRSMESTVKAATNRLESGMAKFNYATRVFERMKQLWQTKSKSEEEYDQAQLNLVESDVDYKQDQLVLASLQAMLSATKLMPVALDAYMDRKKGDSAKVLERQLEESKVQIKEVQRDIERAKLVSPINGVVLERAIVDEQYLAAGTMLLKLGNLDELEFEVDILSQDVVQVKVGDTAEIVGPAIGPKPVIGQVTRIYPAGFTKVSSLGVEQQRVKVIVTISPAELKKLRDERGLGVDYRVRIRVITERKSNVLQVPRSAMFRGADGQWSLFVVRGKAVEQLPVEIGIMNDEAAEIISSNLQADELVVLAPPTSLKSNTKVTFEERPAVKSALPATGD
jgi:HlyD family secretion protein